MWFDSSILLVWIRDDDDWMGRKGAAESVQNTDGRIAKLAGGLFDNIVVLRTTITATASEPQIYLNVWCCELHFVAAESFIVAVDGYLFCADEDDGGDQDICTSSGAGFIAPPSDCIGGDLNLLLTETGIRNSRRRNSHCRLLRSINLILFSTPPRASQNRIGQFAGLA